MSPRFEAFVARLYVDEAFRASVLADPRGEAERAGLSSEETAAVERIDRAGLQLAAAGFEHKRRQRQSVHPIVNAWRRLVCGRTTR